MTRSVDPRVDQDRLRPRGGAQLLDRATEVGTPTRVREALARQPNACSHCKDYAEAARWSGRPPSPPLAFCADGPPLGLEPRPGVQLFVGRHPDVADDGQWHRSRCGWAGEVGASRSQLSQSGREARGRAAASKTAESRIRRTGLGEWLDRASGQQAPCADAPEPDPCLPAGCP